MGDGCVVCVGSRWAEGVIGWMVEWDEVVLTVDLHAQRGEHEDHQEQKEYERPHRLHRVLDIVRDLG